MNKLTSKKILFFFIITTLISLALSIFVSFYFIPFLIIFSGVLIIVIKDMSQNEHALLKNYPLLARLRWLFEEERSKIQQYFIEHDTNGTPYNREKRADVYQKAKGEINTTPFGTQLDVYEKGYEFLKHSMFPIPVFHVKPLRTDIGSSKCKKPFNASIFNISAMSYGALSGAAIRALNEGAMLGGFYQNTGEGGLSPYHKQGGDLCFQIGTGYFGCGETRTFDGRYFNEEKFIETLYVANGCIKMVEIKLSQGAKPAHGGILPASKNTKEIAEIRGIEPNTDVLSPPYHTAFYDAEGMLKFIEHLRELTNGLPIGIKLCIGEENEVEELIALMAETGSYPDFITIDGGEGGTGAAPLVFTNHIGMPLFDGLKLLNNLLKKYGIRNEVKIIASGKVSSSFDIIKLIAMGADVVNAARAFMLSLGCIQARECNKNTCPVGIATQDKSLIKGLDPASKKWRVANYHKAVMHEVADILAGMGYQSIYDVISGDIMVRTENGELKKMG
jgi:glutamate synthase domain-containing protein 2